MGIPRKALQLVAALILLGAMATPNAAEAQVVAFGASNVLGTGVGTADAYPAQLEGMLRAKGYNVSVANAGVYGDTTAALLARLNSSIGPGTTVVILDTSGPYLNDHVYGVGVAEGRANMAAITAKLKTRRIKVIPESTADLAPRYRQDGLHLTAEGHRLVAARVLSQVMRALGLPR